MVMDSVLPKTIWIGPPNADLRFEAGFKFVPSLGFPIDLKFAAGSGIAK